MATFREQLSAGAAKIRQAAGVAITYKRGDYEVSIAKAIKFPQRRRNQLDVTAIDETIQDWGVEVAALILNGVNTEPARGDKVLYSEGAVSSVFEVLPQDGEAVFHLTAADSQFRIHSKRIEGSDDA